MSSKPSYEEIEYQLALTYDAYQKKCKECKELMDTAITSENALIAKLYEARDGLNAAIVSALREEESTD